MVTVLTETGHKDVPGGNTRGDDLWLSSGDAESATGWTLKPEGFCQGDVCVPTPSGKEAEFTDGDAVNVTAFWRHIGRPVLHDSAGDTWMLGNSASERGNALESLEAPDFTLPDPSGAMHSLSDYRGKKVFLTTWSSW
jgi:hypothetical protein